MKFQLMADKASGLLWTFSGGALCVVVAAGQLTGLFDGGSTNFAMTLVLFGATWIGIGNLSMSRDRATGG